MFIKPKIKRSIPLEQIVKIMNDTTPIPLVDISFSQKVSQIVKQEEISMSQNDCPNNPIQKDL